MHEPRDGCSKQNQDSVKSQGGSKRREPRVSDPLRYPGKSHFEVVRTKRTYRSSQLVRQSLPCPFLVY